MYLEIPICVFEESSCDVLWSASQVLELLQLFFLGHDALRRFRSYLVPGSSFFVDQFSCVESMRHLQLALEAGTPRHIEQS